MALSGLEWGSTAMQDESRLETKPFNISKRLVFDAWKRVAANKGGPGVDKESVEDYGSQLGKNLYSLWNRMSSGSYFPKPVMQVLIPKEDGKSRPLGIPTVNDRVAQMVVKMNLEPRLEALFHSSSFGYRPRKSALDAVGQARQNCWAFDWVVDIDIKSFFDTIDHELMMRAVTKHVPEKWIQLYIQRWLKCSVVKASGELEIRSRGTPQGSVISPLLANLYLHYAFDEWMRRKFPNVPFERYADDIVCHCRSRNEGEVLLGELNQRMIECHLSLHPDKTKLVYCKDKKRKGNYALTKFDFLGYSFHARTVPGRCGDLFAGFGPAVSHKSLKRMSSTIRGMKIHRRTELTLSELATWINPMVRGWINYYGAFYRKRMKAFLIRLDLILGCWVRNKYKHMRKRKRRSWAWLKRHRLAYPKLFVHWDFVF